jgi:hypothetical protein
MSDFERCKRLNEAFSYVSDEYLDLVESEKKSKISNRKSFRTAAGIAAACICIFLLPLGVLAAKGFHIGMLILPKENDDITQEADTDVSDTAVISLSGYMDSPEAQALAEWKSFLAGYDKDYAILNQIGNEPVDESRENWSFYGIYTQEMEEKLDEIAEKYGLKLHTECNTINQDELMKRVGGCFMDKEALTWAYMYEDGSFHVEGDAELPETETVASFQMVRSVKGTFNDVVFQLVNVEEYTDWQYLSDCGEPVLLALAPSRALILADFDDCFVSVIVLSGGDTGMTKESLQELADNIDFSILKDVQIPEMSGDSVISEKDILISELMHGEIGNLGTGTLAFTVPCDDSQDYRLYFFADDEEKLKIENADYVFPDAREGNIPIGTFQTFEVFQIGDVGGEGDADILLVGIYGVGEELQYDARVYTDRGEGYVLDAALTQEINENLMLR